MKKRYIILAVIAVVLVISSSIGVTVAYFSTYSDARGGYVIHLGHETEIKEEIDGSTKVIQIANSANTEDDIGKYPLFVRVKVFAGSDCKATLEDKTSGWYVADGIYYYGNTLYAGKEGSNPNGLTTPLYIKVNATNTNVKAGDIIDVIVVYETVPAVFTTNGEPDFATAWATGNITVING